MKWNLRKVLALSAALVLIGGLAWSCYQICLYYNASAVVGCFIAACLVGLLSDICSRVFKEAATIFIIPG